MSVFFHNMLIVVFTGCHNPKDTLQNLAKDITLRTNRTTHLDVV